MVGGVRYYNVPNGSRYPSITTILGSSPKPWLDGWKKSLGQKRAATETKRCATRGTAVHDMIEKYLNNDVEYLAGHDNKNIQLFNKSICKLKNINNITIQENSLYSDTLQVAGMVDCIGEYSGTLSVIDFKTSTNVKVEENIFDYFLQSTFYALAFFEMTGVFIEDIVIIIAVENGFIPQVFKKKIYPYIVELEKRTTLYNQG